MQSQSLISFKPAPHFTSRRRHPPFRCCGPPVDRDKKFTKNYQKLFKSQRLETKEAINLKRISGSIPQDFPNGTYYLIGPGIFSDDYGSTVNPLDGHGYLRAFEIMEGQVWYSAKYVKTAAYKEEYNPNTGSWKFTHRGPFSVLKSGKMLGNMKVMKNVANTTVLKWGGSLLCLWEGGVPYEIEPGSLDTIGECDLINGYDFDGAGCCINSSKGKSTDVWWDVYGRLLKPVLCGLFNMPAKRLLSHYKIDYKRNRLIAVSCNAEDMVIPKSHFTFYEFDTNFKMIQQQEFIIQDHLMIHDWAFTDTHYILLANRVKLNNIAGIVRSICGVSPMQSLLTLNPSNPTTPIYLLRRTTSSPNQNHKERDPEQHMVTVVEVPHQFWMLHCANAFEEYSDDEENLHVQIYAVVCSYQWFSFERMFGYDWIKGTFDPLVMNAKGQHDLLPQLVKVSINLNANGKCFQKCSIKHLGKWKRPCDFPSINSKHNGIRNKYVYSATTMGDIQQQPPYFPFNTIVKLNTCTRDAFTWLPDSTSFIGEPIFISKITLEQEERENEEDDGYLLVVDYAVTEDKCYLLFLDPKCLGEHQALRAKFEVPKSLSFPLGFHGTWDPSNLG